MSKAYLFANKDNTIFIASHKPTRCGTKKLPNAWGIKHKYIDSKNNIVEIPWKINAFKDDNAVIEVHGYEGTNEIWDSGDDQMLGHFSLTKDECSYWAVSGNKMEISELTCNKLWGIIPIWENDAIEVEL